MTVKLAIFKSNERIISDIKEGFYEEKLVCYIFEKPCSVSVNGRYQIMGEDDSKNNVSISLKSWPSLSNQKVVEIPTDWVVTLVEPNEQLKELYETQVLGIKEDESNESIGINEQSDSNQSD
jgi:predicted transcriptional regulator